VFEGRVKQVIKVIGVLIGLWKLLPWRYVADMPLRKNASELQEKSVRETVALM
jgi:hypothetical protein